MTKNDKRKVSLMTRLLWAVGIMVVSIALAIWITGYTYLYKTFIYTYPGIDDIGIFDSRIINDSIPAPWPLSSTYNKIKLPPETDAENLRTESVAFLVIKNDSIAYEQYWDHYSETSLSNSFSASKSVIGILTGIAIKDGLIHIDDPLGKFIPEFNTGENAKLKIRHLLMMSSGLNWDESYNSLFSQTTEAYYGRDLSDLVIHLKVIEEPGKIFRYMSCNTVLLAMAISKASGMLISDYASNKLWKPIGATQPAYWSLDHNDGLEKTYCCLYSNARDFAKIGKLYLDSGKCNGKQIVSAEYVKESVSSNGCIDENNKLVDYYGYQWWLMKEGNHDIYYARGILGQYIIVIPDERIIIVRLGKQRGEKTSTNHYTDMVSYTKGVLKSFGNIN